MIYKNIKLSKNGLVIDHEGKQFGMWKKHNTKLFSADFAMAAPRMYAKNAKELAKKIHLFFYEDPNETLPKPLKEKKPKSTDKAERETKTESMTQKSFIISCLIIVCIFLFAAHLETIKY